MINPNIIDSDPGSSDAGPEGQPASPNTRGRPTKLEPNEQTLGRIEGMTSLLASIEEMAVLLGVDKKTLIEFFKRHQKARAAWNRGIALRNISIRREKMKVAMRGNSRMLIQFGRKYLGQH